MGETAIALMKLRLPSESILSPPILALTEIIRKGFRPRSKDRKRDNPPEREPLISPLPKA
jgi:hypothetical protein